MAFVNHLASLIVNIVVNTRQFNSEMKGVQSRVVNTAAGFYLFRAAALTATASLKTILQKTAELEQGFINIERLAPELAGKNFRKDLTELALGLEGVDLQKLQSIGQAVAELGITGADNIKELTKQVAMLATVSGLNGPQLAIDIGKILEQFNLSPNQSSQIINSLAAIAQQFSTNEAEITNITRRIGAFASVIGLTAEQTIAFAGALKASGQNTEVAASSLFTFFSRLQTELPDLGKALGYTNEEIKELYVLLRTSPADAIVKILEDLQKLSPGQRAEVLKQLELYGVRTTGSIAALAVKVDILKKALKESGKASSENVLLLQQMYTNSLGLTAKINNLKEAWDLFLLSIGNTVPFKAALDAMTDVFNYASDMASGSWAQPNSPINLTDKNALSKEIARLKAEIAERNKWIETRAKDKGTQAGVATALPVQFALAKLLGTTIEDFTRSYLQLLKPTGPLIRELKKLSEILDKLNNPDDPTKGDTASRDKALAEYAQLLAAEKANKKSHEHFQGFMELTAAWKAVVLDELNRERKSAEFIQLKKIAEENAKANGHLEAIKELLKNNDLAVAG